MTILYQSWAQFDQYTRQTIASHVTYHLYHLYIVPGIPMVTISTLYGNSEVYIAADLEKLVSFFKQCVVVVFTNES